MSFYRRQHSRHPESPTIHRPQLEPESLSIFDQPLDRRGTDSIKWGKYAGRDVLPLWVADMDFAAPPAVDRRLAASASRTVSSATAIPGPHSTESVLAHLEGEYGWAIEPEWIVWLPGLVTGLNVACRAVDGEVLTATPIYPPFLSAPRFLGQKTEPRRPRLHRRPLAVGQNCPAERVDRSNRPVPALPPAQPGRPLLERGRAARSRRLRRTERPDRLLR